MKIELQELLPKEISDESAYNLVAILSAVTEALGMCQGKLDKL